MASSPPPRFKPRSFEDQVRLAYHSPPPNAYSPQLPGRRSQTTLGKISEAQIPSALDYGSRERALVPGPGSYQTPDLGDIPLPEGGRLSRKPPQEKFKLDEYPQPAPGAYGVPSDPTIPRQLYGAFGKDPRVSKFIQDEVNRSKGVPAPGSHDVMESMESLRPFCPEGGRYLEQVGRSQSYFDSAAKLASGSPDPGRYNLPGSMNPSKQTGKLVWRYQSETLAKTKQIITKNVGTGHEIPAPGTYNIPSPAPLAPSPTLMGRSLSHSMPHPYAYNCAPDHSGKFASPVLQRNSGDQIYGRDFPRGVIGSRDRAAKARASADEVVANNLPLTLAERDIEQPGESVQWRSGGFAALRNVKSTPVIHKPEHPAILETMHHYPALSKLHGRQDKTFVPMAVKRPEIVKTHSKSKEYKSLQRKKWELGALATEITAAAAATMEPLDEAKLRDDAKVGLLDKAKFRMRMEGMPLDQQDLVLAELPDVLFDKNAADPSAGASGGDDEVVFSGGAAWARPEEPAAEAELAVGAASSVVA